jgi:hypothetical protein
LPSIQVDEVTVKSNNLTTNTIGISQRCSLVMLLSGCAHGVAAPAGPSPIDGGVFRPFRCAIEGESDEARVESERRLRAEALSLFAPADHLRVVRHWEDGDDTFAATGLPCAGAVAPAACLAELDRLEALGRTKVQTYAITTRGDAVQLHQGVEGLTQLLGVIDTPEDAWLVLMASVDTEPYLCDEIEESGYRRVGDAFELARRWTSSTCRPYERTQAVDSVSRAGAVTRVSTTVIAREESHCIADHSGWK